MIHAESDAELLYDTTKRTPPRRLLFHCDTAKLEFGDLECRVMSATLRNSESSVLAICPRSI